MKKKQATVVLAGLLTLTMGMTAFAGQWVKNDTGWWYDYGNGTWPANSWQWIDGDNNGIAECYYFDMNGYILMNTTTPDNYQVDGNGAWIVDGVVQTKDVTPAVSQQANNNQQAGNSQQTADNQETESSVEAVELWDMTPVSKNYYSKKENVRTSQNALWSKAIALTYKGAYVEYYMGGEYSTLSMTAAPSNGFSSSNEYVLEIYGDDDNLLDEYEFNYKTKPTDITVDISGQDYVKLFWHRTEGNSEFTLDYIYMKNAKVY